MKTLKTSLLVTMIFGLTLLMMSLINFENDLIIPGQDGISGDSIWIAPDSADLLINPIELNEINLKIGSSIYKRNCRSCHGRKGDGQGIEAADLSTPATDFTNPRLLDQTDGSLFWKISEGKDDMDGFKKILEEDEIWAVVHFIKSFSRVQID